MSPRLNRDGAVAPAPAHAVRWRLQSGGGLDVTFTCSAPVGAHCRMWCAEGCEERCAGRPDGGEHDKADQGFCLMVTGIQDGWGGDASEVFDGAHPAGVHDGPVDIRWSDDLEAYVWDYLTEEHAPASTDGWMQTFTGRAFYPLSPRPEDVDPLDIAHGLSMACRYAGQVRDFYSVAEHCVLMSLWVEEKAGPAAALWALLHDATEAYMGDMVRPLKRQLPAYAAAEAHLMDVICFRFGLDPTVPAIVKEADNRILQNERAALLGPPPRPWESVEQLEPLDGIRIVAWSPAHAEQAYLTRLSYLLLTLGMQP